MVKNAEHSTKYLILIVLLSVFAGVAFGLNHETFSNLPLISKKSLQVKASIPYWEQQEATKSFQQNIHSFDYIQVFWYFISEDGSIKTYEYATEDEQLIQLAHKNSVKVLAIITNLPEEENTTWGSSRVENILKDDSSMRTHINDILEKINNWNLDGVIIDYESVDVSQKDKFSTFIETLSHTMHANNKIVAVSVHPKKNDNDGLGKFQDWKKLSQSADHISIMSYGEHWDESGPGPIASTTWLKQIIDYTKKLKIPGKKIYLGIPLYGLVWKLNSDSNAEGLTYQNIEDLIRKYSLKPQWDNDSNTQYLKYQIDGTNFEIWFENQASVEKKLEMAQQAGFAGVSFWRLGGEDSKVWETIKKFRRS